VLLWVEEVGERKGSPWRQLSFLLLSAWLVLLWVEVGVRKGKEEGKEDSGCC
jgi:hypothetical protein